MKILITNLQLYPFRGSENWCMAVGTELVKRGHDVYIYSPMPREGIPFFEVKGIKFVTEGDFDLILENHNVLPNKCKGKVIIHTCHGTIKEERPMYNAINVAVSEKAAKQWGLSTVIKNGIDTERMKPLHQPNKEIKSVLSLCSSLKADNILSEICNELGYRLTTTVGHEVPDVEHLINNADLVFGVGRSLYDSMSCGRPVISFDCRCYIHDMHGCGYVVPEMLDTNKDNMTGRDNTWTKEQLIEEIKKYNPEDGIRNREYIINNLNIKDTVDKYMAIYEERQQSNIPKK